MVKDYAITYGFLGTAPLEASSSLGNPARSARGRLRLIGVGTDMLVDEEIDLARFLQLRRGDGY
jgi:hypothetical protein